MHLFDAATNFYGGNAIVGGGLPLAVGLALADKMRRQDCVTACFFGEGAVAEGEFHESLNLASLWSLPVLFVGWEGVGLCSYLLIGFWFTEQANAAAGKKAFVVNRVGDAGFLLATFLLFWNLPAGMHSLTFSEIAHPQSAAADQELPSSKPTVEMK